MKENWSEKIFCRNVQGRDLFYIELKYDYELYYVFVNVSLPYNFDSIVEIKTIIEKLENIFISKQERDNLIEQIFLLIQDIPDISSQYISEDYLDKNGRFMQYYYNVAIDLLFKRDFCSFSVFSPQINAFYFYNIKENLESSVKPEYVVSKEEFEKLISNNIELQFEYVQCYSDTLKYYCVPYMENKNNLFELYIMTLNDTLIMFFLVNK